MTMHGNSALQGARPSGTPVRLAALMLLVAMGSATGLALAELGLRATGFGPEVGLFTVTEREFRAIPGSRLEVRASSTP